MIVGRKCALSVEEAEQCYRDYCRWLEALERYSPKVLAKKYGISKHAVRNYGRRAHKRRAA